MGRATTEARPLDHLIFLACKGLNILSANCLASRLATTWLEYSTMQDPEWPGSEKGHQDSAYDVCLPAHINL